MIEHWTKLLTGDCNVIRVGQYVVYPIHRVGYTSLMSVADEIYTNKQLSTLNHINVLVRDPRQRFVSGVNEYCDQRKVDVQETYAKIVNGELIDSHFVPQYIWLMKLYRFYKGKITIRPFEFIANITDVHLREDVGVEKVQVEPISEFVQVDHELIKNTAGQTPRLLSDIIMDNKHALS